MGRSRGARPPAQARAVEAQPGAAAAVRRVRGSAPAPRGRAGGGTLSLSLTVTTPWRLSRNPNHLMAASQPWGDVVAARRAKARGQVVCAARLTDGW